ncbi:MAG: hypothetical protein ACREGH_03680 [Minisyncoccia bacterium]
MNFIRSNLTTILVLIVCVVAVVAYQKYFASGGGPPLTSSSATSTTSGAQLLSELNNLKQVTLNPAIFSDPLFVSLIDYGVAIPPEPYGRPDPFAPIAGVGVPEGGSAGVSPSSFGSSK